MDQLSEGLRKLILAGIGAVAATKEKSEGILDELVKKGELTVEQGKVLNEELKHNIKDAIRENVTLHVVTPEETFRGSPSSFCAERRSAGVDVRVERKKEINASVNKSAHAFSLGMGACFTAAHPSSRIPHG
ncbi:MAG: phasin family protein [Oscillospiraceae bacterium]